MREHDGCSEIPELQEGYPLLGFVCRVSLLYGYIVQADELGLARFA